MSVQRQYGVLGMPICKLSDSTRRFVGPAGDQLICTFQDFQLALLKPACIRQQRTAVCGSQYSTLSRNLATMFPDQYTSSSYVPLQGVQQLTRSLLSRAQPKRIGIAPVSGVMLAGLAEAYVAAINQGVVPTIATAWQVRRVA